MLDIEKRPIEFVSEDGKVAKTLDFRLPLSDGLRTKRCFLRPCFPDYYKSICDCLELYDQVTITGTPGIGVSVFFVYFAACFREENPHLILVTASYSRSQRLDECLVYRSSTPVRHSEIPIIDGAVYLFDGPADLVPPRQKLVCFTSHNVNWSKLVFKSERHTPMFLPPWTLKELKHAERLEPLRGESLDERFDLFGGIARHCLYSPSSLRAEKHKLESKIKTIKSYRQVMEVLGRMAQATDVSHCIFHSVPIINPRDPRFAPSFRWEFGSSKIRAMISANLTLDEPYRFLALAPVMRDTTGGSIEAWLMRRRMRVVLNAKFDITLISAERGKPETIALWNLQFRENRDESNGVDASSTDDEGILCLFKVAQPVNFQISTQAILEEAQRRTRSIDLKQCKLIWVVFNQPRSYEAHALELPHLFTSGDLISRISQYYTVVDQM